MTLDLDRMLAAVQAGQWSVDDLDWSRPLAGAERLSAAERREAGLALLMTAGLERQAARIFALCARYVDDPRAVEIYRWFEADELRHAEAEVRLARRYGVEWDDLPAPIRWMFHTLVKNFDPPDRGVHELSSATILLFELALDSILIPTLKGKVDDPLQAEVFRRIDRDESRHLAMDYWLLERKGELYRGRTLRELLAEDGPVTLRRRLRGRYRMSRALVALLVGFAAGTRAMPSMSFAGVDPAFVARYLRRVNDVPRKAPAAMGVPTFRMGLRGQRWIMQAMWRINGRRFDPEEIASS
jgi:hypothetical protein